MNVGQRLHQIEAAMKKRQPPGPFVLRWQDDDAVREPAPGAIVLRWENKDEE